MTTQRPKPQDTQLGILKIYAFSLKIQQRASCPGESAAGVAYLSVRIHPKSCHMFHLKVATTKWFKEQRSWSIAVTQLTSVSRLHGNTSTPDVYRKKLPSWQTLLELSHRNLDLLERVLNRIALSNSTAGKCAPTQVIKHWNIEHWRTSTTEEQK